MQMWELVRRLLGATGPNHSFTPGLVANQYRTDLDGEGTADFPSTAEFSEWAQDISDALEAEGLIKSFNPPGGAGAVVLGAMVLTELGYELSHSLNGRNVVLMFESMMVEIERGEILRILHQLNS
ncbi:MAG: hypothetical protein KJ989_13075 [Gammaproteobacteria bacterium]|uniref:Uncharacterized protein n=1 Tax=viral metagenome TaxID=1070528 RepID=A0A6M3KL45_9ZZZZ|nr:hypothetical protein [Gammaproteobacteria bacterium]MBU2157147.1 hypothetical protein [Gammaproteobacteria bacterium]MBU2256061.1 hypothetical protein [Gammaproteobacteria bacterium]MBU2295129.1 hypothetical protein [Gammaproteobacteria bacterium]